MCLYPLLLYVLLFCKTTYDGFTPVSACGYRHPTCYIEHKEIFFYKVVYPRYDVTYLMYDIMS
jgi:hypothetical protein